MAKLSKDIILAELAKIRSPHNNNDIVASGIISSVIVRNKNVGFVINVGAGNSLDEMQQIRKQCEDAIYNIFGVDKVTAVLTNENSPEFYKDSTENKPVQKTEIEKGEVPKIKPPSPKAIPGVKKIIAVASGKGGVGKSTIATHLALSLAGAGKKTGLVDADILGPSVAKMMGLSKEPEIRDNKMIPREKHGVKVLSMGLLMGENTPMVWRGPMVTKALHQLMLAADWGELDYLIMDLPPGTGDIQLSMAQNYKIDGVILVSTPQEVALLDVKKAAVMFMKVNIPIIGLLENMSYYEDGAGEKIEIFGKGHCERFCRESGIKFLGQMPILPEISAGCDKGIEQPSNPMTTLLNQLVTLS